ncbi:MAG: type IV toxin-antitoxin system AbiEi family antitoxin domain-containing protein, partial [Mycobacteriales bacterium]
MPTPFVPEVLTHGPFTTAQAIAAGVSSSALRRSPWRHVFRDVWAHVSIDDDRVTRISAARL